ncbi:terminase large subunit [Brucella phage BiPBO1]|uniref:terminase large subunit n=2 Tax=root TaxID=1 RepID=UPI00046CE540|nr:terminase large subunit [Brucella phage BiPBO1]ALJ98216.1 terminase large subunit [Brucella phage BiPBO1]
MNYSQKAHQYARGVVSGAIPACKYVYQACARQLNDLDNPPSGYHFDAVRADRVCRFVELCPHIKGPAASRGDLMILEPWQVFVLSTAFGWVDADGNRRFRRVYVEVPRGNGKSSFSSPVGLYMLALDGEAGAEVYSAATTRDQARIVFRDAQAMARKMPGYRNRFGVDVTAQAIVQLKSSSAFKALSAEGHTLDGLNIHLAIVDELHAHKNRDVYDVLETGLGKRPQSMLWMITTAGSNKHGICYEVRKFVLDVLAGHVSGEAAEAVFGIIYTIDEGDDPFSEETLRKANPNWGVSVDPKIVMQTAGKARQVATARANYLTKHLNVWVDANSALFDTEWWRKCEDRTLDEADFTDDECVIGLDLASKIDIAARVNTYRRLIDGKAHYYVFPRFYLPRVAIDEDRHPMYRGWEMQGDIVATTGETIDFSIIEDDIRAEAPSLNLQAVATDPWQAQQMIQNLKRDGMPAEEYRQTVATMSEATKTLDALMREGRIHHTGNAVMNWMIGNVVGHYDAKENVYPRKEMPQNKIDGAVALIMSLGWFIQQEADEGPSIYETRGILVV